jgi:hypothetical protein
MSLPFLHGFRIDISQIPSYPEFADHEFQEPIDKRLAELLLSSSDRKLTKEMKDRFRNSVYNHLSHDTPGMLHSTWSRRHGFGRFYPDNQISMTPQSRFIKHSMYSFLRWRDLDMVKAHPSIGVSVAKQCTNNTTSFVAKQIELYIQQFPRYCDIIRQHHQLDELQNRLTDDDIKYLFNLTLYGGGMDRWVQGLAEGDKAGGYKTKKVKNPKTPHPEYTQFKACVTKMNQTIFTENPEMANILKQPGEESWKTRNRVVSYWYQTIECHVLYITYKYLVDVANIIQPYHCVLEYDGLCIPPHENHRNVDMSRVLVQLNEHILSTTGLSDVKMKWKTYGKEVRKKIIQQRKEEEKRNLRQQQEDTFMDIIDRDEADDDVENMERDELEAGEEGSSDVNSTDHDSEDENGGEETGQQNMTNQQQESFDRMKAEFENTNFKLIWKSCFGMETKLLDGTTQVLYKNQTEMRLSYSHLNIGKSKNGKPKPFFDVWMNCPAMRMYDTTGLFPNPADCPPNMYNIWTPFRMELYNTQPYERDETAETAFLNHILILCNREPEVAEYIVKFIAHIIQYPEHKPTKVPVFISQQGAGKGTLLDLLEKLLGTTRMLVTDKPHQVVWGTYNPLMSSAMVVVLDDCVPDEVKDAEKSLKGLISNPEIIIRDLYRSPVPQKSLHRFIVCSNEDRIIKVDESQRRYLFVRCSDELCNPMGADAAKTQYFDRMHAMMNNLNSLRSIYDYLKYRINVPMNFDGLTVPVTTFHHLKVEEHRDFLDLFMEWFSVQKYGHAEHVILTPKGFHDAFEEWRGLEDFNAKFELNQRKLGINISKKYMNFVQVVDSHRKKYYLLRLREVKYNKCRVERSEHTEQPIQSSSTIPQSFAPTFQPH